MSCRLDTDEDDGALAAADDDDDEDDPDEPDEPEAGALDGDAADAELDSAYHRDG